MLDLPELKTIKPSDTRWLAHERCVKAVKGSYSAIVNALNNIYEQTHEPEALGISKVLCKPATVSAIYLLDYALLQVAKLSRSLQAEKIYLTVIAPLVDVTINTLDDAILPVPNWVLELLDTKDDLEAATDIKITTESITSFQDRVAKPFITMLKNNISSQFVSQDVVTSFSIFDPKKVPTADSSGLLSYGEDSVDLLIEHYGAEQPAETVQGDGYTKEVLISPELRTEWKTFRSYLSKQPKGTLCSQLTELSTDEMLTTIFPNISTLANICLTIPVSTASVERSFSQIKLIKIRIRNRIGQFSLSHLIKIAIEMPETLSDAELDAIITTWNRKPRRIAL